MKDSKTKVPPEVDANGTGESANRRRLGRVVHDDRGCASVEWHDAPQDYVRPVLELEDGAETSTRLKALREKAAAPNTNGAKPLSGASTASVKAKSSFANTKKTTFQRKAV